MQTLLTIVHIVVSIFLCLVILLQSGRGGGMGAAFGGASAQLFGGRGAANFLSRLTSVAAVIFFLTSLTLSMISSRHESVVGGAKPAQQTATPDAAGTAADEPAGVPPTTQPGEAAPAPDAPTTPPAEQPQPQ